MYPNSAKNMPNMNRSAPTTVILANDRELKNRPHRAGNECSCCVRLYFPFTMYINSGAINSTNQVPQKVFEITNSQCGTKSASDFISRSSSETSFGQTGTHDAVQPRPHCGFAHREQRYEQGEGVVDI